MRRKIGEVQAIFRYPVKSMRGEALQTANLGWFGVQGDRRLAFRKINDRSGFPWLTATKLPGLILFQPVYKDTTHDLPSHVRTPDHVEWPLFSPELASDVSTRHGHSVEITHLNRGIFDEASISLITSTTVDEICRLAGTATDARRFRPNILLSSVQAILFEEEEWIGGTLTFGESEDAPAIAITNYDERCAMVNLDPNTAQSHPEVLKTVVRIRNNNAGVYATVVRRGEISAGQHVFIEK